MQNAASAILHAAWFHDLRAKAQPLLGSGATRKHWQAWTNHVLGATCAHTDEALHRRSTKLPRKISGEINPQLAGLSSVGTAG